MLIVLSELLLLLFLLMAIATNDIIIVVDAVIADTDVADDGICLCCLCL